jgi:hypothetical protein
MPKPVIDHVPIGLNYKHNSKSDMVIRGTNLGTDGTIKIQYPEAPSTPKITWKGRANPHPKGGKIYLKVRLTANNPGDIIPTKKGKGKGKGKRPRDLTDVSITATNHDTTETSDPVGIALFLTDR